MPLTVYAVEGLPLFRSGDDLASLIVQRASMQGLQFENADIVVVAQKVVSKIEGRQVLLESVTPSTRARAVAEETEKDPRLVELILQESTEIIRKKQGVLITRHRLGHVGANAGIDQSNISHKKGESALLLPLNPDASARKIQTALTELTGKRMGVIVSDSANRPWRLGSIGIAIGASNVGVLDDRRGTRDIEGRELKVTLINVADSIASAACLVMGETDEKCPVAVVKGLPEFENGDLATLANRPIQEDLFR